MDNAIIKIFEETVNQELKNIVISNSTDKDQMSKVKIRPVLIKEKLNFQVTEYIGNQVFHKNYQRAELIENLPNWFDHLFRQAEIITLHGKAVVLISKNKKATVNYKKNKAVAVNDTNNSNLREESETLQHNRKKQYILQENTPIPFLVDLGVMTKDGKVVKAKSDKFKQINRFLEFIEDILPHLDKEKELTILDFGCGKSYLTFAMYYYLRQMKGYRINIIGLDLKAEVIEHCNKLSERYGYDKLHFLVGDIASYTGSSSVDMVVTLHACDTATDHALHKAVTWGAKVILSVPCCQHELNKQLRAEVLKPVLKYGIVKERMAALITDAIRAELLEQVGYRVQLLEFIDMEHTPKNILIRAVKRNANQEIMEKDDELKSCMEFLGISPCLQNLLEESTTSSWQQVHDNKLMTTSL